MDYFEWGPYIEIEGRTEAVPVADARRASRPAEGRTPLVLTTGDQEGPARPGGRPTIPRGWSSSSGKGASSSRRREPRAPAVSFRGPISCPRPASAKGGKIVASVIETVRVGFQGPNQPAAVVPGGVRRAARSGAWKNLDKVGGDGIQVGKHKVFSWRPGQDRGARGATERGRLRQPGGGGGRGRKRIGRKVFPAVQGEE